MGRRDGVRLEGRDRRSQRDGPGGCRRKVMDEYLDGYTERVGCIIEEEEICDQCRARGGEVHRSRQATAEEASQVGEVRRDHEKEAYQQLERGYSAQRRRLYERAARAAQEWKDFERELAWWKDRCGMCQAMGKQDTGHALDDCVEPNAQGARWKARKMKRKIKYAEYRACYGCGVPQKICQGWESRRKGIHGTRRRTGSVNTKV